MDFRFDKEAEAFRAEVKGWLKDNLPESFGTPAYKPPATEEEEVKWYREWQNKRFDAGYVGALWPEKYGGRGNKPVEHFIITEEIDCLEVAHNFNIIGFGMAGPTILHCGNEEQRERFIKPMLKGEDIWCQGFSEPNCGSDLAAVNTRAIKDGEDYIINGQKIWITYAHHADYCILVTRTNLNVPKHKGLSYFIVDMKAPGITANRLKQMTGDAEFNEIFFEDVRVPANMRIGEEDQGWGVAITTLMFERAAGLGAHARYTKFIRELTGLAKKMKKDGKPAIEDPIIRQKLAQAHIEAEVLRMNSLRELSKLQRGEIPGPEGSFTKLFASELNVRIGELSMEILGPYHQIIGGGGDIDLTPYQFNFLRSRANTIEAGSSEIIRNIIGERVLGLPKDASRTLAKQQQK